jgi:hypothetical protein
VYNAHAEIGRGKGGTITWIMNSEAQQIRIVNPAPPVYLVVRPPAGEVGLQIAFFADFKSDDPNIQTRFVFGDRSQPTAWTKERQVTHEYSSAGTFTAYAELGRTKDGVVQVIARSATQGIEMRSPLSWWETALSDLLSFVLSWWKTGILVLAAFVVSYGAKKWLWPPRPTFHSHLDMGRLLPDDESGLSIEVEFRVNPHSSDIQSQIDTQDMSFVKASRRKNG